MMLNISRLTIYIEHKLLPSMCFPIGVGINIVVKIKKLNLNKVRWNAIVWYKTENLNICKFHIPKISKEKGLDQIDKK